MIVSRLGLLVIFLGLAWTIGCSKDEDEGELKDKKAKAALADDGGGTGSEEAVAPAPERAAKGADDEGADDEGAEAGEGDGEEAAPAPDKAAEGPKAVPSSVGPAFSNTKLRGEAAIARDEPEPKAARSKRGAGKSDRKAKEDDGAEYVILDETTLDISSFVSADKVKQVFEAPGLSGSEPLGGVLPAREYVGARFFDPRANSLGVSAQVWRFPTTIGARRKFDVFSQRYPGAEKAEAVGTMSFFASGQEIRYLGFLEQSKKAMVVLACSEDICDLKEIYLLAKAIHKKL
jgi:hypothetical protein